MSTIIGWLRSVFAWHGKPKPPSQQTGDPGALFMEATKRHDAKDLEGAIALLRTVYEAMGSSRLNYPIETFTRLPLYLQKAGHYSEAMSEFNRLLGWARERNQISFAHKSMKLRESFEWMDRSVVYDKMRVAAKRQKDYEAGASFGLRSHACRCVGLVLQDRRSEAKELLGLGGWQASMGDILKRAELTNTMATEMLSACLAFSRAPSGRGFSKLEKDLCRILQTRRG